MFPQQDEVLKQEDELMEAVKEEVCRLAFSEVFCTIAIYVCKKKAVWLACIYLDIVAMRFCW